MQDGIDSLQSARESSAVGAAVRVRLVHVPPAAPAALFRPRERVLRTGNTVLKKLCREIGRAFTVAIQIVYFAELLQNACAERLL